MPVDQLRPAVQGLMGRAKDDLAELVAFKSVADPKQYPPEECAKAAEWVVERFAAEGLQDVTASLTPDGSRLRPRLCAGPRGVADRAPVQPLRRAAAARRGPVDGADLGAHRARRPLVRARLGGLQGQHRHAPHGAARAAAGQWRRLPVRHQDHLRGLGGAGHRWPRGVRAAQRRPAQGGHDPRRRHRQLRRRRADADDHAARDDERRHQAQRAGQRDALRHVRRAGAGRPARPDPDARDAARRARQHDRRRARRNRDVDRRRLLGRAVPQRRQRARRRRAHGRRHSRRPAVGAALGDRDRDRRPARARLVRRGAGVGRRAREPAAAARRHRPGRPRTRSSRTCSRACRGACTARSSASRWATRSSARSTAPPSSR